MKRFMKNIMLFATLFYCFTTTAQTDSIKPKNDSIQTAVLEDFNNKFLESEQQRVADSIKKADLEARLKLLSTSDNLQKEELLSQLKSIEEHEQQRIAEKKARIELLKSATNGFPVLGVLGDTLFVINTKIGASTPKERATRITTKIANLYKDEFLKILNWPNTSVSPTTGERKPQTISKRNV